MTAGCAIVWACKMFTADLSECTALNPFWHLEYTVYTEIASAPKQISQFWATRDTHNFAYACVLMWQGTKEGLGTNPCERSALSVNLHSMLILPRELPREADGLWESNSRMLHDAAKMQGWYFRSQERQASGRDCMLQTAKRNNGNGFLKQTCRTSLLSAVRHILRASAAERLAATLPTHCCQKLNLENCSLVCSSQIAQLKAQSLYWNWVTHLGDHNSVAKPFASLRETSLFLQLQRRAGQRRALEIVSGKERCWNGCWEPAVVLEKWEALNG